MSNISQFFAGSRKKNRRIIHGSVGVTTITWLVPPGVTEVEVHCWGAGASATSPGGGGGGGGGYVTHVFPVTPSDRLLITAGASPGGTSSVSIPTQSPISPISATGGSLPPTPGGPLFGPGGSGGTGAYTIAPGISTARTFSASGGAGASGDAGAGQHGGGGAAGSPFGTGGAGAQGPTGAGGGIGGNATSAGGGGSLGGGTPAGGAGKNGYQTIYPLAAPTNAAVASNLGTNNGEDWFYVDEILGAGGNPIIPYGGAGGGAAGSAGFGGILGGGSGGGSGGRGGLAGGAGGSAPGGGIGGAGLVILYW